MLLYNTAMVQKNGYGSLRGDPDVWNSISSKGYGWGYGSRVRIDCVSEVWIGILHFELQPYMEPS